MTNFKNHPSLLPTLKLWQVKKLRLAKKKVTVMGLGLYENGSGISATRFLVSQGAKVTVTDLKTTKELAVQIKRLGKLTKKIKFVLGRHREKDFKNIDLIIKNPGVRNTSKYLKIAVKNKIPIETDISLFFQLVSRKRIIGVTGTRGKSTTVSLLYEILKTENKHTILGGNITKSPLAQMAEVKKDGSIILELSSWMLESLESHQISPHISIFTNIFRDHLNTYNGIKDYISAKENIWRWQNLQDYVILNRDDKYVSKMGSQVLAQRFWVSMKEFKEENGCFIRADNIYFRLDGREQKIISTKEIKLLGEHNVYNVMCAISVAMIYGIKISNIKKVVENFKGIADRLELVREIKGVKYYNDTTATMPDATVAALWALPGLKSIKSPPKADWRKVYKVVLIGGGSDKELDFKDFAKEVKRYCKVVVLFRGNATEKIKKELKKVGYKKSLTEVGSMADAVGVANSFVEKGDIVLLSPGATSFGLFDNEFDRGNQFREIVGHLKSTNYE